MSHAPRSRLLAGALAATLALGGLAACSGGASSDRDRGRAAPDATFTGLLRLIPNTADNRENILITRYDVAEAGAEPWTAEGSEQDRELTRLSRLGTQTGISPLAVLGGVRVSRLSGALGFVPSDATAGISAGNPPAVTEVALVDADEDAVLDAAEEAVDGATRDEVGGVDVVRWLDDAQIEPALDTPVGGLPGQAGRLAWTAPGALAYTTADPAMSAAIGAGDGDEDSLADVAALASVADGLDEADAYAALLTTAPIEATPGPRATPEQIEAFEGGTLEPYAALGVGGAWGDDGLELVIVLAHDDDDSAAANAAALTEAVADGASARTGQPWSELLGAPDVAQDGEVVVARFTVDNPGLWQQLVIAREPLLAVG